MLIGSALLMFSLTAGPVATTGDEAIAATDKSMTAFDDQTLVYDMITKEPGRDERILTFRATVKGPEWRRVEFLAPGDIKGMQILVRSVTSMYVYLPAFGKVRRLASHVKEQGFMGTAFGHEDFSLATYGGHFAAKMIEETERSWRVEATRRPGSEVPFPKLIIEIRRDISQPVQIEYFNERGVKTKTETRLEFKCVGTACAPKTITMVDHTRNDMVTTMVRKEWQINANVPDSFFTVRALQRGR